MYLQFIILMKKREAAKPLRQALVRNPLKNLGGSVWTKVWFGEKANFFATEEWNKKMIGHLEDLNGLRLLKKNAKM
ncbi:MAG: hypothetical protein CM1200mP5_4670 [Candidatus Pelagibacterales bacterium]|nr:MAG: hypothetical protein CM1200mP5_4670 [Pelagibacterales bacterium]